MKTLIAIILMCSGAAFAVMTNPSDAPSNTPINAQIGSSASQGIDLTSPTHHPEVNPNVDTIKSVDGKDPTHPSSKKRVQQSSGKKKSTRQSGSKTPTNIDSDSSL